MANILYYSKLNPIRLYLPTPDKTYHSRHIDDFVFFDTIDRWEDHTPYYQPWESADLIRLQLQADFGPHNINLYNEQGVIVTTVAFQQARQNVDNPNLYIYEVEIDLSALPQGGYQLELVSGIDNPLKLVSDWLSICQTHRETISLEYSNTQYHEGVFFDTDYLPSYRVEGCIKLKTPASKDSSYQDQTFDETLLQSTPYNVYELTIGDSRGVPDAVIDTVNRLLSCDTLSIDGRRYSKPEGARWEVSEEDGVPTRGWKIELREAVNRPSRLFNNNQPVTARISIVINADSKGFGLDTGGTTYEITDVQ